jgi:hydrogenase small subunit
MYGRTVRALRNFTKSSLDKEPTWRRPNAELTSGYVATNQGNGASAQGEVKS